MSEATNKGQEHSAQGGRLVMIVEDEALIAFDLSDLFSDAGFEVSGPFSACAQALEALETGVPDVAVLDAVLSDGSCLELARELRKRGVPFLIYSGADEFEANAPELDGVRWIEKPAPVESVVEAAKQLSAAISRSEAAPKAE
jgi:DNA-binding response OmpR family regulator